ncbi:MAG TPA: LLM class flavin-dependent oxidoreductase [Hyphomicrobiaceae bacterium]|nr:LLM class flavin-dependent oxidoreductase [Hyphomicrobiaceae bacterium]
MASTSGTRFGIFSLSQFPDQAKRVESFDNDLMFFESAEALGYDEIWIAEHLFSTYGVVTSTQVYAAAIAQRTKRIRIGMAVVVIPFNHPLRTASDFALVDVLSHGRLDFGIGRAYQPHEFVGLGVPMEESREMLSEGIDIVLRAWKDEKVSHKGRYWTIPEPVEVLPKPVQQPHPPVFQATVSPESFEQAARSGFNLQMASPFTYRTYRETWRDELARSLARHDEVCRGMGRDPKTVRKMILLPFFVHEDQAKARAIYKPHVEWFYAKVTANQLSGAPKAGVVKGYELTMSEGKKTREMGYLAFDKLIENGAAVVGDPKECVAQLRDLKSRLGITDFALWFNIGGIDPAHVTRAMRLCAEKVMPEV